MKRVFAAVAALALAGCVGPFEKVTEVDPATATALRGDVTVLAAGQVPAGARSLGPVEALSCRNLAWDKPASREDAITQLKLYARQKGGNAVANVHCEGPEGTSLLKNCWSWAKCTGTALSIGG